MMMGRNLFGGPPSIVRGEMRQAMVGGDAPGAKSRARARQQGRPIPGEPGSEGARPNGGLLPDTAEGLAASFNRVDALRRAPGIDPQRLQKLVRQMMNGGR